MGRNLRRTGSLRNILLVLAGGFVAAVAVRYLDNRRVFPGPIEDVIDGIRLRRESLLDITDAEHPVQETVVVAEFVGDETSAEHGPGDEGPIKTDKQPGGGADTWMDSPDDGATGNDLLDGEDPNEWLEKESAGATDDYLPEPDPTSASATGTALDPPPEEIGDIDRREAEALAMEQELLVSVTEEEMAAAVEEVVAEAELIGKTAEASHDAVVDGNVADQPDGNVADQPDGNVADYSGDGATGPSAGSEGGPIIDGTEPSPKWVAPVNGECPPTHQIKARFATGRYHEPGTKSYPKVVPDCCYATVEEAEADGFSRSRW